MKKKQPAARGTTQRKPATEPARPPKATRTKPASPRTPKPKDPKPFNLSGGPGIRDGKGSAAQG